MYFDDIIRLVAPITGTVYDSVAMSFPVPTTKGNCVLYYQIKTHPPGGVKMIEIVTGALVNAGSCVQISACDVFSEETIHNLHASDPTAGFVEVFQQRKSCEKALNDLVTDSDYETSGFSVLRAIRKDKLERLVSEIEIYASMLGLQAMYAALLGDLTELIK